MVTLTTYALPASPSTAVLVVEGPCTVKLRFTYNGMLAQGCIGSQSITPMDGANPGLFVDQHDVVGLRLGKNDKLYACNSDSRTTVPITVQVLKITK